MLLSSGSRLLISSVVGPVLGAVAQHRVDDVDASASQGDECLVVSLPLGSFALVERPRAGSRWIAQNADW